MMTKMFDNGKTYEIDDTMVRRYFDRLTGRIFKIIPIREEGEFPVQPYMNSLLREMLGAKDLMFAIGQDERYMQCLNIMNYLSSHADIEAKEMRGEVFHILSLIKKIGKTYVKPKAVKQSAQTEG